MVEICDAMKMASKDTCSFAKRPIYKRWVSTGFLQLIEAHLSTPGDRELDNKRKFLRNEIVQSLSNDWEAQWPERVNELGAAAASGNWWQLSQLFQAIRSMRSVVSGTICKTDRTQINNI